MFEQLKFNASLLRDSVVMRTTLFSSKEGPYRTDTTMKTEHKDDAAKAEFIKNFMEGYYVEKGQKQAKSVVETINNGVLFNHEPISYQDHVADQDDIMMSVAAYIAQAGPEGQIKQNHMTNKFLAKLNETCEYLGMRKYVIITDEQLNTRKVVFEAPDYSKVSPEMAETLKKQLADREKREKEYKERMEKIWKDAEEYNAKLKKDALKELEEENKKKAEKKAKKEAKKSGKEVQKEENKKTEDKVAESKKINLDENIGQPSFMNSHDRGRAGMTQGASSAGSTNKGSASKGAGKGGKSDDSGDGDPDPAASQSVNLNEFIPTEEVMKSFPIIDVDEEEKKRLLAQNERERIEFIRANGGNNLRSTQELSEATKKKQAIDETLANGGIPNIAMVEDALKSVNSELNNLYKGTASPVGSGRFFADEINDRTDLQLIQDSLNDACSGLPGMSATVTPMDNYPDQYLVVINQNSMPIDKFTAYGSRIMGRGVPVLDGIAVNRDGKDIPYFVPLRSRRAVMSNIFRNAMIQNIDGEIIGKREPLTPDIAAELEYTICGNYKILDHVDLSAHAFNNIKEMHSFFYTVQRVLENIQSIGGYADFDSLPRYRVGKYKNWNNFELLGDQMAFNDRPIWKADTTERGKEQLGISGPDNRHIKVSGNNVQITQPDGNVIKLVIS